MDITKEYTREQMQAELDRWNNQLKVLENRELRLRNREKYRRKVKDRKRTHRLIQYGVVMESHHRELEVLRDEEIYGMMERIVRMPPVEETIAQAVTRHNENVEADPREDLG